MTPDVCHLMFDIPPITAIPLPVSCPAARPPLPACLAAHARPSNTRRSALDTGCSVPIFLPSLLILCHHCPSSRIAAPHSPKQGHGPSHPSQSGGGRGAAAGVGGHQQNANRAGKASEAPRGVGFGCACAACIVPNLKQAPPSLRITCQSLPNPHHAPSLILPRCSTVHA